MRFRQQLVLGSFVVVLVALAACSAQDEPSRASLPAAAHASALTRDTVAVRRGNEFVTLTGIAPIVGPDDERAARDAVDMYLQRMPDGEQLVIERSGGVYARRADGDDLGAQLIREGLVRAVTGERHARRELYVRLETEAREQRRGLWGYFEPEPAMALPPDPAYHVYRVYYATDRLATGDVAPNDYYGPARGAGLQYGTCEVSIPPDHRMGELERPSKWRFEWSEDPEEHVVLLKLVPQSSDLFFSGLASDVAISAERAALVFVHGFNVEFADAARRTAQLAYDLGFDGAPVLYSWPSRGGASPLDYVADMGNADWSAQHLRAFLEDVARKTGAERMHVIAHSMGNRVVTGALRLGDLVHEDGRPVRLDQLVLTAPDIDAQVFREQIAPAIRSCARRITLYASSADEALKLSNKLHAMQRAGESGDGVVVVDGVDSIDVSRLDTGFLGHSYFAEHKSVIADLMTLLRHGKAPSERPPLTGKLTSAAARYWEFP